MNNKSRCKRVRPRGATEVRGGRMRGALCLALLGGMAAVWCAPAAAGDAPGWMRALVNEPLPAHDEKTDAVVLYAERVVTVESADKIRTRTRVALKILRPSGRSAGTVRVHFDAQTKISGLHGWCIPAQGKVYEVKDKDAVEVNLANIEGSELVSDVRDLFLRIPAADPGNLVGFEYQQEGRPYVLQDIWDFQEAVPIRETSYTLQLPAGWEYKAGWRNHAEVAATPAGANGWQWQLRDVPALRMEEEMAPERAVAGELVISFFPPGGAGQNKRFTDWHDLGVWYTELTQGRREASPAIKQKVAELTGSLATPLEKMQALARFLQREVRYVAIELGIGGYQPHPATEVFQHRYGDCKDKATLLSTMLKEIGVESYYVIINSQRGVVTASTPAFNGFDHAILAIRLPEGTAGESLVAVMQHPKLGRLLFFDPTSELTPFGMLSGPLQENYGLLAGPEGGELVELPLLLPALSGVVRKGTLTLSANGTLSGDVQEMRVGDRAEAQRYALRTVKNDADKVKPLETLLAHSMASYRLTRATVGNADLIDRPFIFQYSLVAENYAKTAGNLLLVRPRVLGEKSSALLETKEPRRYAVMFAGPSRDMDEFEITLPAGYVAEELPPAVSVDYGFAQYHSKSEMKGNVLHYVRTFEVRQVTVPLEKVEELKKLYRIIATDERNTAVLKPATP